MEIGDVYVVNKADRPGASITRSEIDATLSIAYRGRPGVNASATLRPSFDTRVASPGVRAVRDRHGDPDADAMLWRPPVHEVCARTGEGVDALASSVDAYLQWAGDSGRIARKRHERLRTHLLRLLADRLLEPFQQRADGGDSPVDAWARRVVAGEASPGEAVERLIESVSGRVPAATRGDLPPDAGPTARRSRV
jgi:LAO/AO transport system kinase